LQSEGERKRAAENRSANEPDSHSLSRVTSARAQLLEAEKELRRLRQKRRQLEGSRGSSATSPSAVTAASLVDGGRGAVGPGQEHHEPRLTQEDVKALVSHTEPLPAAVLRLAHAIVLLLKAKTLVEDVQEIPDKIPWKNMQALIMRAWSTNKSCKGIVAALSQKQFGKVLRDHICQKVVGGDAPLTRGAIEAADTCCIPAFNFMEAVIFNVTERGQQRDGGNLKFNTSDGTVPAALLDATEVPGWSELIGSIASQEQKVARLRRHMRDELQSEDAVRNFVCEHSSPSIEAASSSNSKFLKEAGSLNNHPSQLSAACDPPVDRHPQQLLTPGGSASGDTSSATNAEAVVTLNRVLQYRLNEINVPSVQETILQSVLGTLLEPRAGSVLQLEIQAVAEAREEEQVAEQRAAAVEEWLLTRGVPPSQVQTSASSGGQRGERRVELRVLDAARKQGTGSHSCRASHAFADLLTDTALRKRAQELMSGLDESNVNQISDLNTSHTGPPASSTITRGDCTAGTQLPAESLASSFDEVPPPVFSIDVATPVEDARCGHMQRELKVVFTSPNLSPADTSLEVGDKAVRISSKSGKWPDVEAPLPCEVEALSERAARFSRSAGTLTLRLKVLC